MLTFLKRIFRKKRRLDPAGRIAPRVVADSAPAMPRVETASLQLAAILARFPDELKALVIKLPPTEAMVKLPVPTIQKFLPTGSVKMSLASVVRQSPPGTFGPINTADKRLVEVPLAEIFKRVSPAILKKRVDQRYAELAEGGVDIFGDDENPHALAPRVLESPAEEPPPAPAPAILPAFELRTVAPSDGPSRLVSHPSPIAPRPAVPPPAAAPFSGPESLRMNDAPIFARVPKVPKVPQPPQPMAEPPPPRAPAAPAIETGPLELSLTDLAGNWPEPIKSEALALNGATLTLPSAEVSAGLAKGKVAFAWGQIRAWLTPPPSAPTQASEDVELPLPLRIVAPAFLKLSTSAAAKAKKPIDQGDIPALFTGKAPPQKVEAPMELPDEPLFEPAAPPSFEPAAPPVIEIEPPVAEEEQPVFEITPPAAPPPTENLFRFADEEHSREAEVPVATAVPAPIFNEEAAPVAPGTPQRLGEFLGQADKTNWSPEELVAALMQRPEIDGAVVALQEGLVVAHQLPEGMKGEVFAAFLPQVFARLNLYSGEMKLGAVEDLVITAAGGQCQLFRVGQIYFAVLAKLGATLPTRELRLCANALTLS